MDDLGGDEAGTFVSIVDVGGVRVRRDAVFLADERDAAKHLGVADLVGWDCTSGARPPATSLAVTVDVSARGRSASRTMVFTALRPSLEPSPQAGQGRGPRMHATVSRRPLAVNSRSSQTGVSLVELLVATVIAGVTLCGAWAWLWNAGDASSSTVDRAAAATAAAFAARCISDDLEASFALKDPPSAYGPVRAL